MVPCPDQETEEKILKKQIIFIEGEIPQDPKKWKTGRGLEHEKVKAEFELDLRS
jgi:hypothetical protein